MKLCGSIDSNSVARSFFIAKCFTFETIPKLHGFFFPLFNSVLRFLFSSPFCRELSDKESDESLVCWRFVFALDLSLPLCLFPFSLVWVTLLLNSISFVPLLVGICAEMDDTSFVFIQFCSAAVQDLRQMDDTSFKFVQYSSAAGRNLRRDA